MLLLYILWYGWPIFIIPDLNEQLQQKLEYTHLKPDCYGWWISKMKSRRQDTLEERYAIKFCFKLEKMPQKRMECFTLLLGHLAWIEHQFLSGIRDSRKAECVWGMMGSVGGIRKSIHLSWLGKVLGLGLLCWGFKGVQKEILSEEASTSNRVSGISTRTMHQTKMGILEVPQPPYSLDLVPCDFWLFPKLRGCCYEISEKMKEAVTKVIDTLTQEDFHGAFNKLLERYKCISAGGDYFEMDKSFVCVLLTKVPIRKKVWKLI